MPTASRWEKMKLILQHKNVALFVLLFTVLIVAKKQSEKWHQWSNKEKTFRPIVRSDGSGYYAYLPQIFIYDDNRYHFIEKMVNRYPDAKMGEFGNLPEDRNGRVNKYFVGVAICQSPFFLAAHWLHGPEFPSDGYSFPYQRAVAIGAMCYLLLGLWLTYLILLHFRITPWFAAVACGVIALGTTLLYYNVNDPLTAHGYSFAAISFFVYSLIRWRETCTLKWLLLVSFSFAMVILLRPSNGIVFLLYFAFFANLKESWQFLVTNLFKKVKYLIPTVLVFAAVIGLQIINVYYQTGKIGFNIYQNESFSNWNKPPFIDVLFGFRKGLFIYAPITFISLLGYIFLWKKHKSASKIILVFLLVFTYVTASWWNWWYGGSLGMRPFVDVSLLFILGLAFLFQFLKPWLKIALIPIVAFCIYFHFILTIQIDTGILHFAEMNKERFWQVFLKKDIRFQWIFHIDEPKKLNQEPCKISYWNYNELTKSFTGTPKLKPGNFTVEHMLIVTVFQKKIDSLFINMAGLRVHSDITINDHNNVPWFIYDIYSNGEWKEIMVDFIGMRLPSLKEPTPIQSDWVFTEEMRSADSLRIRFHNTHGKTTLGSLRYDLIKK